MENWQNPFSEFITNLTDDIERFFWGVHEVVDSFFQLSEEINHQIQNSLISEIEQQLNDLAAPLFEVYWELEEVLGEQEQPYSYMVDPKVANPACVGCRHYHGQVYGGNLLVCGMHPYGTQDEHCHDWEK